MLRFLKYLKILRFCASDTFSLYLSVYLYVYPSVFSPPPLSFLSLSLSLSLSLTLFLYLCLFFFLSQFLFFITFLYLPLCPFISVSVLISDSISERIQMSYFLKKSRFVFIFSQWINLYSYLFFQLHI